MRDEAMKYYREIAQRVEAVLEERLRAQIDVDVITQVGLVCHLSNEMHGLYFDYNIPFRWVEANHNDVVIWCANEFIEKYRQYIEQEIIYR